MVIQRFQNDIHIVIKLSHRYNAFVAQERKYFNFHPVTCNRHQFSCHPDSWLPHTAKVYGNGLSVLDYQNCCTCNGDKTAFCIIKFSVQYETITVVV
jgi:hypothetical protein